MGLLDISFVVEFDIALQGLYDLVFDVDVGVVKSPVDLAVVVAVSVWGLDEVDVLHPVVVVPGQGPSENKNYITTLLQIPFGFSLVAMNPTVSLVLFFHTWMFFMSGLRWQGAQLQERTSSSLQ